jgi:hypothetical protein
MNVEAGTIVAGAGAAASAGVAWGVVKAKMYSFITFEQHRGICRESKKDSDEKMDLLFEQVRNIAGTVNEIRGYLKGKDGEVP